MKNADDTPTPEQIERQIEREAAAVAAGLRRYREEINGPSRALADTSPGQKIIREIMRELVPALTEAQEAIKADILGPGRKYDWMFLLLLLPVDVLAFLTIRAVMTTATSTETEWQKRPTLLTCARSLVAAIEVELAFRTWKAEERANKREARELGKPYRDLYEALQRSVKTINARTFQRWMRRIGRLWRQGWPDEAKVQLGAALIGYMVECGGGQWFTFEIFWRDNKKHKCVVLSEKALALIADEHARLELMHPEHRPMLIPPRPVRWEYGKGYVGGYYLIQEPLIRTKRWKHTAALVEKKAAAERAAQGKAKPVDDH